MFKSTFISVLAAVVLLAGCSEEESAIRIGSKSFGESRVLAHMMAAIATEQGLPVEGVVEYENTPAILEALKRGDIDAYPEYNGTGLVMLGQSPLADGDEATARVKEVFEPLGISWRERVGFANNYGLAMLPDRAEELGLTTMTDLAARSSEVSLGIEDDFDDRPLDGLNPMVQRYGFEFGSVEQVPLEDRGQLYDMLLDEKVDVIEVYTTDGQIADYGLTLLEDNLTFFPVYELAPIVRMSSLSEFPELGGALDALGGKFSEAEMQALNRKVDLEGRAPDAVARDALARLGLISSGAVEAEDPLLIATSAVLTDSAHAGTSLRAVRRAFVGREVAIEASNDPLAEVASGNARLAMVGAERFFDISGPAPRRLDQFESVAAVGTNVLHFVATTDGDAPKSLQEASALIVGPEGSSTHQLGMILKDALGLNAELVATDAASAAELIAAIADAGQVALISGPLGLDVVENAFDGAGLKLLPITGWTDGGNLVKYPFLRQTRIPGGTYALQFTAIETLSSQVVLAGPAPAAAATTIGEQGPGATAAPSLKPVPTSTVQALAGGVSDGGIIDPVLPIAAAFAPALPEPPAAMNPSADVSILNVLLVLMFVWVFWLYTRREVR
ncbi:MULTISPECIES: glycine betaine ABC transporter substrate-binding protein [unclassified Roseovarius]|uniref:glycine betaine ABC transporter substrate-binding protein n=1 Tax=unclassified Roseovarius TaxID=2614913 RepID=UPI00273DFC8F|nr:MULTISPECIES: glycine betaine ABC transporter substrate-binding protein [unclassified Roseovarius]